MKGLSSKTKNMKFRSLSLSVMFLLSAAALAAQTTTPSSDEILQKAYAQAAKEKKNVMVLFTASWCGWCKRMDKSLEDPSISRFINKNYVLAHLVVNEAKDKKDLENPGAVDFLKKHNGADQGIPFWLIMDKDGKLLADSKARPAGAGLDAPGSNTGCPATAEEVGHFIDVLKKTSKLKKEELALIEARFRQNETK